MHDAYRTSTPPNLNDYLGVKDQTLDEAFTAYLEECEKDVVKPDMGGKVE
jgi:hypothetical protein